MRTLRQCLFDGELAMLRVIAGQWGIELPTNRHDDAVDLLSAHLADVSTQAEMLSSLPDAERQALYALLGAGGTLPSGAFARRWGDVRPMGPGRLERERPWTSPASVAEALWYRGLIFKAFEPGPSGMHEVVFVPQEYHAGLPSHAAPTRADLVTPRPLADVPKAVQRVGAQLADDVCTWLIHVHASSSNVAAGESPERQLRHADPIRLDLIGHLAARLMLVRSEGGPLRPDPQRAMEWLPSATRDQQRALFEAWRVSEAWNDLWRVPALRCENTGSWHNEPLTARRAILEALARLEPGAWYRVDDIVAAIREAAPDFQRPGGDYDIWYIRDAATNEYLSGFESWDRVEGALLRFLLGGPLHWLGVVDVDETGIALCVAPLGEWLLGKRDTLDEASSNEAASFVVCDEGMVQVSAARRYERFQLARVADWVSSGGTYTYRITPASLARAKAQRIGVERVLEFLGRASSVPVPPLLTGAVRRWETHGTEAWAQQAVVLRVARPEVLDQMAESPRTRKYIRETVSSTVALVAPHDWPELVAALLEMGILPEIKFE